MTILAFYSIKGGVGKTSTCVNLAYLAAAEGAAVLLCDLDPQGSASFYFRVAPGKKDDSRHLLKGGRRILRAIKGSDFERLDLLPADISFRQLDIQLSDMKRSRKRLRELLKPLARSYDYIFLDCPPSITLISENVFRAADFIWVPLIPTVLSLHSFAKLTDFFDAHGLDAGRLALFFSMVEQRKRMHRELQRAPLLQDRRVLAATIPYLSEIEQMGLYRQPLPHRHPHCQAAEAYRRLWREMKSLMRPVAPRTDR